MKTMISDDVREELDLAITKMTQNYLDQLEGMEPHNFYIFFQDEVDRPMLEFMMEYSKHNVNRASTYLGVNPLDLIAKLKRHNLL
ncbi:Fis family transcriptional regulator (plasmid) [Thiothrix fructosivorans]|uniref:Fis family transcriptional regulator n=2 Tax=Thiothrix fructosivorans TaxID=111770 RepID=A0A8B0SSS2_9GAMM|nr:Fis family transcriptional regulator [Thiothrix fructosivorans]QTX13058.1 Fis family transcriptional regulator [Thiothrix fructosivorans]